MAAKLKEYWIMSVLFISAFTLYSLITCADIHLTHYIITFICGFVSMNLIAFINRAYLLKRYKNLTYEKLCDKLRFFYDTLVVVFAGIIVSNIALLPVLICSHSIISPIQIQFSQIIIVLICITFSLIYHSILYTHLYVQQNVKLERLAKEKIASEIEHLQSQFSPKLIFNTLEHVETVLADSKSNAQNILDRFSHILRYKIYEVNKQTISLTEEISYIAMYTQLLAELKLATITIKAQPPSNDIMIKPLLLQACIDYFVSEGWNQFTISSSETNGYNLLFSCNCPRAKECLQKMQSFFEDSRYRHVAYEVISSSNSQTIKLSLQQQ